MTAKAPIPITIATTGLRIPNPPSPPHGDDWNLAIEFAKEEYRMRHPGGCRLLTYGESCRCFLCSLDRAKR